MSHKKMYSISTQAMLTHLRKLSLVPGDVLVVKDFETLDYLAKVHLPLSFNVPLVFSPKGIGKLTKQDLLNLLEQLEQAPPTPDFAESPSAPL
jgi:hypothetical protein